MLKKSVMDTFQIHWGTNVDWQQYSWRVEGCIQGGPDCKMLEINFRRLDRSDCCYLCFLGACVMLRHVEEILCSRGTNMVL